MPTMSTTITIPRELWVELRSLAEARAAEHGGRPSASRVVADLIARESERQREERARG